MVVLAILSATLKYRVPPSTAMTPSWSKGWSNFSECILVYLSQTLLGTTYIKEIGRASGREGW